MDDLAERKRKANIEFHELIKAANLKCEQIRTRLTKEGVACGLDTNREAYAPVHEELKRKVLELYDKYDLPNKPKL